MEEALTSYLLQHKSICIPGLGTIYIERTPAQNDFVNKKIIPPGYHYRFDQYFDQPDKDFFTHLARQQGMADFEAIKWYNEWAYDLRSRLRTAPVSWKDIGTLRKDENGEVVFEAERVPHTAFKPVKALRIHEWPELPYTSSTQIEEEISQEEMIAAQQEATENIPVVEEDFEYPEEIVGRSSADNWWIYAIILGAIALSFIFFYFYGNGAHTITGGSDYPVKIR